MPTRPLCVVILALVCLAGCKGGSEPEKKKETEPPAEPAAAAEDTATGAPSEARTEPATAPPAEADTQPPEPPATVEAATDATDAAPASDPALDALAAALALPADSPRGRVERDAASGIDWIHLTLDDGTSPALLPLEPPDAAQPCERNETPAEQAAQAWWLIEGTPARALQLGEAAQLWLLAPDGKPVCSTLTGEPLVNGTAIELAPGDEFVTADLATLDGDEQLRLERGAAEGESFAVLSGSAGNELARLRLETTVIAPDGSFEEALRRADGTVLVKAVFSGEVGCGGGGSCHESGHVAWLAVAPDGSALSLALTGGEDDSDYDTDVNALIDLSPVDGTEPAEVACRDAAKLPLETAAEPPQAGAGDAWLASRERSSSGGWALQLPGGAGTLAALHSTAENYVLLPLEPEACAAELEWQTRGWSWQLRPASGEPRVLARFDPGFAQTKAQRVLVTLPTEEGLDDDEGSDDEAGDE